MIDVQLIFPVLFYLYLLGTVIFLLLDNREASSTFAWLFLFFVFPLGGLVLYLMIGRNWRPVKGRKEVQNLHKKLLKIIGPLTENQQPYLNQMRGQWAGSYKNKLFELLYRNSNSLLTVDNSVRVFQDGTSHFDALFTDIENAKHFIHLEYYIWRRDALTRRIRELLKKKISQGVEVRVLFDAMGSLRLYRWYVHRMRKDGIQIYPYYDFLSVFSLHTLNFRNHRKVAVIDGTIAYTGGMNMGQEYIDGGRKFDVWRDTHIRLEGQAVPVLQGIFLTAWYNTVGEDLFEERYFPLPPDLKRSVPIQITTSGPDSEWDSIKQLYFSLITSAEKSVYIQSPYFIPDMSIYTALKTAALSGLDVRIMVTGQPDKKLPYWSAFTFFETLLKAGVRIFHYQKGFLHSKTIVVDDDICSVGTANIDIRSFQLNYEVNSLLYDRATADALQKDFMRDMENSREFTLEDYNRLSALIKLRNSGARLFAPLL